jgi:xanthine dehydrogenase accessory factor
MNLEILRAIEAGTGPLALATVLQVKGSAPRHAGSMMLAGPEGLLAGTVGGGRGESLVLAACRERLETPVPVILDIDMQGTEAEGSAMVCGGTSRLLVEPLASKAPFGAALDLLARGERALLVRRISTGETAVLDGAGARVYGSIQGTDPALIARALESGHPLLAEDADLFCHPLLPREKLLILGGGHVGRCLAALAPGLGFEVTVGDDREAFLASGRFPASVATRGGSFTEIVDRFPFDASTYVVIVTRGHLCDLECVRAVLGRPYRYAGFMGSLRKTRLILGQVLADGRDPREVESLAAPIGLELGAETPEELAVAIAAELIASRRNADVLQEAHQARKARRSTSPQGS